MKKLDNVVVPKKSVLKKLYDKLEINKNSLGTGWSVNNC